MIKSPNCFQIRDEVHSADAYHKNPVLRNNNLIVPYINLGIGEHELNRESNLKFIDFAYLLAIDISFLSVWIPNEKDFNGRQLWLINRSQANGLHYWGGSSLDEDSIFLSMTISCRAAFIYLLPTSQMSKDYWTPIKGTRLSKNMDDSIVENFFSGKMMPEEVGDLIS